MNKDNTRLWIADLRRPDVQQARGTLRIDLTKDGAPVPGYCCLGRACDVAQIAVPDRWFMVVRKLSVTNCRLVEEGQPVTLDTTGPQPEHIESWRFGSPESAARYNDIYSAEPDIVGGVLSPAVAEWLGTDPREHHDPIIALLPKDHPETDWYFSEDESSLQNRWISATKANDTLQWNFAQIADALAVRIGDMERPQWMIDGGFEAFVESDNFRE